MPRRRKRTGTAVGEAGDILGEIAALIQRNRQQGLEEKSLAHSQAMEEQQLGLAKDELRFRRTEAARQREAAEQAKYEATLPGWKAKAYQHELGAELAGQAGRYAERAGPLAGKVMSKAFEEAGSIDQVNALMAEMGTRINEMDKLTAREDWLKEQPPDFQAAMTAMEFGSPQKWAEMVYMMERSLIYQGLMAAKKATGKPPQMSSREKFLQEKTYQLRKWLGTDPGAAWLEESTEWNGKLEDDRDKAVYRKVVEEVIRSWLKMSDEETEQFIGLIKPSDVREVSVGNPPPEVQEILSEESEEEEFDIESVLKKEK